MFVFLYPNCLPLKYHKKIFFPSILNCQNHKYPEIFNFLNIQLSKLLKYPINNIFLNPQKCVLTRINESKASFVIIFIILNKFVFSTKKSGSTYTLFKNTIENLKVTKCTVVYKYSNCRSQ